MKRYGASIIIAVVWACGAGAQTLTVDAEDVRACLDGTPIGETYPDCLGQASDICQAQPGGSTTIGITDCITSEYAAWDALLNEEYQNVRRAFGAQQGGGSGLSGEELNNSLLAAQRAWIAFRDAECSLQYDRYLGGTIRGIVGANCLMVMTASRTIALRDMAGE